MGFFTDLTCKRGSVGQSEGLSIPRSSVRFRLKPDNSNSHGCDFHRPSNKGTKLLLKVIKAIIIIIGIFSVAWGMWLLFRRIYERTGLSSFMFRMCRLYVLRLYIWYWLVKFNGLSVSAIRLICWTLQCVWLCNEFPSNVSIRQGTGAWLGGAKKSSLVETRGGGLGSRPIFKKFHETYAPS